MMSAEGSKSPGGCILNGNGTMRQTQSVMTVLSSTEAEEVDLNNKMTMIWNMIHGITVIDTINLVSSTLIK